MQKKFFSLITSLTLILSSFVPFTVFAADEILAAFEYTAPDGTTSGTALADRDSSGGYGAASGVMKASAMLFASVNGEDYSELEWSETYDYGSDNRIPAPVMAAGKKTSWCESPYFKVKCSAKGYKDIKFSADQRSTEKGPRDYAISVSTDGVNYTPLANSSVHVADKLNSTYSNISFPSELNDKETIYIKIKIDGGETLSGAELESSTDDPTTDVDENVFGKGNTEINNIELCGIKIGNGFGIDGNPQTIKKGKTYMINFASAVNNPALILAGYNSNREMVIYNLHAGEFTIPSDSDVTDIKIMLWESLTNITPIVPALTKTVE